MPGPAQRSTDWLAEVGRIGEAVRVLERQLARGTLPVGDDPPGDAFQPDGSVYLQRVPPRAHFRLGGAWRHVDLT